MIGVAGGRVCLVQMWYISLTMDHRSLRSWLQAIALASGIDSESRREHAHRYLQLVPLLFASIAPGGR